MILVIARLKVVSGSGSTYANLLESDIFFRGRGEGVDVILLLLTLLLLLLTPSPTEGLTGWSEFLQGPRGPIVTLLPVQLLELTEDREHLGGSPRDRDLGL
jgi:hypothetical protein